MRRHKVPVEAVANSKGGLLFDLARFRYRLRLFLRFSERAARAEGVTPQQHQLLLGVAGFTGKGWATISELAEFMQERHNAVVGLVERAVRRGLVTKAVVARDHRFVRVALTPLGSKILEKLVKLHRKELLRFRGGFALPALSKAGAAEFRRGSRKRTGRLAAR